MPLAGENYHIHPWALPQGRGLIFTAAQTGGFGLQVGVKDAKDGSTKLLMPGARAAYSPSGHLLVVTEDGQLLAAPFDLDRLELTGQTQVVAERVHLPSTTRADLAVSATGDLAYVAGGAASALRELVWISRSGVRTPADPSWRVLQAGRLSLSPDGRRVATGVGSGLNAAVWVKELDAGPATRVSEEGVGASWTSDGNTLYFLSRGGIARAAADGSTPSVAVRARASGGVTVTPDGERLVWAFAGDLYTARIRGDTSARTLVADRGVQSLPAISPDGRWLAYHSDETGTAQVYVRPFPDAAASRKQVSVRIGWLPQWSRSGRELFFVGAESLWVAAVGADGTIASGAPRALFSTAGLAALNYFTVAPDAQRFLFSQPVGADAARQSSQSVVYVQNFAAELRARFAKP